MTDLEVTQPALLSTAVWTAHVQWLYIYVSNFFLFFVETFSDVCIMDVHTQPQVQRQRFRWQASGSEEHPSESLLEEGPVGVCVFECVCV